VRDLNIPDLVIGKMDAKNNDSEGVDIKVYPTLIWYSKEGKKGETVSFPFELEVLKKWVSEHSESYREAT